AWGRREPTDPDEVLDVALRAPQRLVGRIGTLNFVPMELGVTLVAQRQFEFGVAGVFALALGLVMVIGGSTLILGVAVRILYVPVLNEVQPLVDDSVASIGRSWSLRARIILAIATACLAAGLVGGAAGAHVQSAEGRLLAGGVGGLAMAVYGVLLIGFGLILPSVAPVRDLVSAVRRVADGDFTQRVAIASADEFGEVAVAFNNMQRGLRERESLQAAFGSYVDPALAERILAQGDSVFGGEEVDVTVFFADVRGFTTFAAERSAQEAVARLNELFALVVPIIRDNGGHANTYAGDGVLAVFGTPNPLEKHADCAVAAAIEMQRAVHAAFGDELHIGIGVNTGTVIAGTIGGGGKLEFTVIGDAVNVASRVEELTKETGDDILLTQATVDALVAAPDGLTGVGEFPVRGKAGSVRLHAVR
ncbi:MAG: adenylate cyclase, partial [Actinomycetota bacterium]